MGPCIANCVSVHCNVSVFSFSQWCVPQYCNFMCASALPVIFSSALLVVVVPQMQRHAHVALSFKMSDYVVLVVIQVPDLANREPRPTKLIDSRDTTAARDSRKAVLLGP